MYVPGVPLSRSVAWNVQGRQFRFTTAGDRLMLQTSDGALTLSLYEWQGVAAALAAMHPAPPQRVSPAPVTRRAWSEADDGALCRGWYAGIGLGGLAGALGRSETAVATRLVRLDLVGDRAEARRRP
jgi:hypothetical protein